MDHGTETNIDGACSNGERVGGDQRSYSTPGPVIVRLVRAFERYVFGTLGNEANVVVLFSPLLPF